MAYTLVLPEGQVLTVRFVDSAPVVLCHWTTDGNYPQIHSTTSKYQDRSKVSFRSPEKKDAAMKSKFLVFRLEGNAEHSKIGKDRRRFVRRAFSR